MCLGGTWAMRRLLTRHNPKPSLGEGPDGEARERSQNQKRRDGQATQPGAQRQATPRTRPHPHRTLIRLPCCE